MATDVIIPPFPGSFPNSSGGNPPSFATSSSSRPGGGILYGICCCGGSSGSGSGSSSGSSGVSGSGSGPSGSGSGISGASGSGPIISPGCDSCCSVPFPCRICVCLVRATMIVDIFAPCALDGHPHHLELDVNTPYCFVYGRPNYGECYNQIGFPLIAGTPAMVPCFSSPYVSCRMGLPGAPEVFGFGAGLFGNILINPCPLHFQASIGWNICPAVGFPGCNGLVAIDSFDTDCALSNVFGFHSASGAYITEGIAAVSYSFDYTVSRDLSCGISTPTTMLPISRYLSGVISSVDPIMPGCHDFQASTHSIFLQNTGGLTWNIYGDTYWTTTSPCEQGCSVVGTLTHNGTNWLLTADYNNCGAGNIFTDLVLTQFETLTGFTLQGSTAFAGVTINM